MKMRTLARVLLAVLGVYLLSQVIINFGMFLPVFFSSFGAVFSSSGGVLYLIYYMAYIAFLVFLIFQLLFRGQKWAKKIVPTEEVEANQEQAFSLPVVFRLGLVLCGVFIIYSVLSSVPMVIFSLLGVFSMGKEMPLGFYQCLTLLGLAFRLAIGVYLVFGAPHFVRWQVKKTLEQCGEN